MLTLTMALFYSNVPLSWHAQLQAPLAAKQIIVILIMASCKNLEQKAVKYTTPMVSKDIVLSEMHKIKAVVVQLFHQNPCRNEISVSILVLLGLK